ncbi:MAG: SRPBCC domain-containing protein [Pseudomonadota bacterium]
MRAKSYEADVTLKARPSAVYAALATEDGIKGWWTTDCDVGSAVGDTATFRFGRTWNTVRIDRLEPNREVRWHVTGQYHHAPDHLTETSEWVGTAIVFTLTEAPDGDTLLRFRHDGLTPELECYDICDEGWTFFLKTSLAGLVEHGKGQPADFERDDGTDV